MTLLSEIQSLIQEIYEKSQVARIFNNKCKIVAGILRDIRYVFEEYTPDEEENKKQLSNIKQNLSELLKIVNILQDDQQFLLYMIQDKPLQQIILDINKIMKNINLSMKDIGFGDLFKIPPDSLFDDYDENDNLLLKTLD